MIITGEFFAHHHDSFGVPKIPLSPLELQLAVENGDWTPPIHPEGEDGLLAYATGGLVIVMPKSLAAGMSILPTKKQGALLTRQQQNVLEWLARGLSISQISHQLNLSERQVRHHINHIKDRLGASTNAQALGRAAFLGLIDYHPG